MKNKPNKVLAVLLALVFDPLLALCYVRQPLWGLGLFALTLILGVSVFVFDPFPHRNCRS